MVPDRRRANTRRWILAVALLVAGAIGWMVWGSRGDTTPSPAAVPLDIGPSGSPPGGPGSSADMVTGEQSRDRTGVELQANETLASSRTLDCSVVRWPDGARVTDAVVTVTAADGRPVSDGWPVAVPLEETILIHAHAKDYLDASLQVAPEEALPDGIWLTPTVGYVGRIVDGYGRPIAGAQVAAWIVSEEWLLSEDSSATPGMREMVYGGGELTHIPIAAPSSNDGWFYVEPARQPPISRLVLFCASESAGWMAVLELDLPYADLLLPEMEAKSIEELPAVHGVVKEIKGPALDEARAFLSLAITCGPLWSTPIDTDGSFRLPRVLEPCTIGVEYSTTCHVAGIDADSGRELPHFGSGCLRIPAETTSVELTVALFEQLRVRVVDAGTGSRVAGARVAMDQPGYRSSNGLNPDGVATPRIRADVPATMRVTADGYETTQMLVTPAGRKEPQELQVELRPSGRRRPLSILARSDGEACPRAQVFLLAPAGAGVEARQLWRGETDEKGEVVVRIPPEWQQLASASIVASSDSRGLSVVVGDIQLGDHGPASVEVSLRADPLVRVAVTGGADSGEVRVFARIQRIEGL